MFSFRPRSIESTGTDRNPLRRQSSSVQLGFDALESRDLPSTISVGPPGPLHVALGDLNDDGRLDIVVANEKAKSVSILFGNGAGTFRAPVPLREESIPGSPTRLITFQDPVGAAVDLHGNIIVADQENGQFLLRYFANNGDGAFTPGQEYAEFGSLTGLDFADFNGDGRPDIVAIENTGISFAGIPLYGYVVYLNQGGGNFTLGSNAFLFGDPVDLLALGNFDGNHTLQVVTAANPNRLDVFVASGSGLTDYVFHGPTDPSYLGVGDFNGDGKDDLIFTNAETNTVTVLLGNGNLTFQAPRTFSIGDQPVSAVVGDFSGDGILDLITANRKNNTVSVAFGNGNGTFQTPVNYPVGEGPVALTLGDFTGNGIQDVVVVNSDGTLTILFGRGNGTFADATTSTEVVIPKSPPPPIAPASAETAHPVIPSVQISRPPVVPPLPLAVGRTVAGAPANGETAVSEEPVADYFVTLVDADAARLDLPTERDVLNSMNVAESLFAGQRAAARLIPQPGNSVSAIGALLQHLDDPIAPKYVPKGELLPDVRPWLKHPLEDTLLGRPGAAGNPGDAALRGVEQASPPVDGPVSSAAERQEIRGSFPQPAAWVLFFVLAGLAAPSAWAPHRTPRPAAR